MQKQSPMVFVIPIFVFLGLLACQVGDLFPDATPTRTPTRAPTATRTIVPTVPVAQPVLLPTPVPPPTAVPAPVIAQITTAVLNVRATPATTGTIVDKLNQGDKITVVGRNAAGDWLQVPLPSNPNARGWISAAFAQLNGPLTNIPVVGANAPPTPRTYP